MYKILRTREIKNIESVSDSLVNAKTFIPDFIISISILFVSFYVLLAYDNKLITTYNNMYLFSSTCNNTNCSSCNHGT